MAEAVESYPRPRIRIGPDEEIAVVRLAHTRRSGQYDQVLHFLKVHRGWGFPHFYHILPFWSNESAPEDTGALFVYFFGIPFQLFLKSVVLIG